MNSAVLKYFKLLNSKKIGDHLHRVMSKYNYDESKFVMQMISDYKMKELMPREWFGDGLEYKFESISAKGSKEAKMYLTHIYGDYEKLPPKEKRVGKHNVKILV